MVQAKNYKNKEEVIADFRKAFARKKAWLEEAEKELIMNTLNLIRLNLNKKSFHKSSKIAC